MNRTAFISLLIPICSACTAQTFVIDPTFDPGLGFSNPFNMQVVLQPDGKILVAGYSGGFNGSLYEGITRLNPDGTRDLTFQPPMDGGTAGVALMADGRIVVAGSMVTCNGDAVNGITRLLGVDGANDPSFTHSTDGWFFAVAVTPNGNAFAGGTVFSPVTSTIVYNGSGGTLAQYGAFTADCMQVQPDGNVVVGSRDAPYALRLLESGAPDPSFSANIGVPVVGPGIRDMALLADGRVLVGGIFDTVDGQSRPHIARLNSDGSLDSSFDPGTGFDNEVQAVLLLPDGDALAAGQFTAYDGTVLNGPFARLNDDGSLDTSYAISGVLDMVLQPDGKVVLAGWQINFDGSIENGIMRIMPDINTSAPSDRIVPLRAWPNPAREMFTVERSTDGACQWIIADAMGRTVKGASALGDLVVLPLEGIAPGAYTLRIRDHRGISFVRFSKE